MAMSINTHSTALSAQTMLAKSSARMAEASARLSSGIRINSASDDAGMSISARYITQIRDLNQNMRNANDAISLIQTADGGLNEIRANLSRMRELAVMAAGDNINENGRTRLQAEVEGLAREVDRVAGTTNYSGNKLLDGSAKEMKIQVGTGETGAVTVSIDRMDMASLLGAGSESQTVLAAGDDAAERVAGSDAGGSGTPLIDITTKEGATDAIKAIDNALAKVADQETRLGSLQNRFTSGISSLAAMSSNLAASRMISDADFATEVAQMSKNQIIQQAGVAMLGQSSMVPQQVMALLG